jgi:hypothetical protein
MTAAIVRITDLPQMAGLSTLSADRALEASLPPSVKLDPVFSSDLSKMTVIAYKATGAGMEGAIRILEASLRPAGSETVEKALTEMALLTKASNDDEPTQQMRAALYLDRLSEYPTDAVIHVCRSWADTNVFWPAWAELREKLESRVSGRRMMLKAIRRAAGNTEVRGESA